MLTSGSVVPTGLRCFSRRRPSYSAGLLSGAPTGAKNRNEPVALRRHGACRAYFLRSFSFSSAFRIRIELGELCLVAAGAVVTRDVRPNELVGGNPARTLGWVNVHGEVVSRAVSARENDRAAEVSCETIPAFRGRGYARQVCAAWASRVLKSGRVGFYSYDVDNAPSAALAASLAVAPQFDVWRVRPRGRMTLRV